MRWVGDETQARAEAEDCIILLLLAAAATLSVAISSVPPPWLLNISSPLLSLFSPCPLSRPPCSPTKVLYPSTGTEHRCASHEIPDRGKFDQILYTHMASNYPLYISSPEIVILYSFLQRLLVALRCPLTVPGIRPNGDSHTNKRRSKYCHLFPSFDSLCTQHPPTPTQNHRRVENSYCPSKEA
jgi:hypothetical protein